MPEVVVDVKEVAPRTEEGRELNPHRVIIVGRNDYDHGSIRVVPPILTIGNILELARGDAPDFRNEPDLVHVATTSKATLLDFDFPRVSEPQESGFTNEDAITRVAESLIKILDGASSTTLLVRKYKDTQGE